MLMLLLRAVLTISHMQQLIILIGIFSTVIFLLSSLTVPSTSIAYSDFTTLLKIDLASS